MYYTIKQGEISLYMYARTTLNSSCIRVLALNMRSNMEVCVKSSNYCNIQCVYSTIS